MARKEGNVKTARVPVEVRGLSLLLLTLLTFLSLISFQENDPYHNWLGLVGHAIGLFLQFTFGLASFAILIFTTWMALRLIRQREIPHLPWRFVFFCCSLFSLCILLNVIAENFPRFSSLFSSLVYNEAISIQTTLAYKKVRSNLGGVPFYYLYRDIPLLSLQRMLSDIGTSIVFSLLFFVSFMQLTKWHLAKFALEKWQKLRMEEKKKPEILEAIINLQQEPKEEKSPKLIRSLFPEERPVLKKTFAVKKPSSPPPEPPKPVKPQKTGDYTLPPLSLLTNVKKSDMTQVKRDLSRQAEILEETLLSFGIEAKVGQIFLGPTITSFEIHPATGVKVQRIKSLENDIALNLQARSIRILAPIPGKACVGVEIPSPKPQEVSFKELLETYFAQNKKFQIPVLLGQTVTGEDVSCDLTKMPHCIIAGATGSGKSVCINTLVMAILMTAKPDQIKLLMVDPKKVELTAYSQLPHLIAPVITEASEAAAALNWLVKEMEKRYEILKHTGQRNITSFNERRPSMDEAHSPVAIPEKLPYIVGIIDELADLMMVSASDIETPIARIAQMARAVGIHLVLATQRPSREVITGLIKANFPTRIAFKVASRVNSQIILDEIGAEALLGNGDMLFLAPGTSTLARAQGAFIRDEDINQVIRFIADQMPPSYLIKSFDAMSKEALLIEEDVGDSLYKEAKNIVQETGNASTTFLQRKLKIGYARAASLIDLLQAHGIVGPQEGAKPRKVLKLSRSESEDLDN